MKIKKLLIGIGIVSAFVFASCFSFKVFAEEAEGGETQQEVQYSCKVIEDVGSGGNVTFDKLEGNVGDTVTAYVKPEFLFSVSSVKVNGTDLQITSDGKYEFVLVEGNNTFSVEFVINNEKLQEIAVLVNQAKEEGITSLFTVENLLTVITWVVMGLFSSGFFFTLIKNKKLKAKTVNEVQYAVNQTVSKETAKAIENFLNGSLNDIIENILTKIDGTNECMQTFCRCLILAQDGTPESRLAIVSELTKLLTSDEKLSNQIRAIIKEEQEKQQAAIAQRDKAIEELKESNENLVVAKEEVEDNYGQL